jgi:phage tail-like protein
MDANGSRYHALIGRDDWLACLPAAEEARALEWRAEALTLKARLFEFQAGARRRPPLAEESGRGGVFDAYGNLYCLASDRRGIRIRSSGSGANSDFWPLALDPPPPGAGAIAGYRSGQPTPGEGVFQPAAAPPGERPIPVLDALSVSAGHYLVAASHAAGGLLIFDLYAGGPPLFQAWPALAAAPAEALLALADGGVGALIDNRLWRTGPDLKPRLAAEEKRSPFAAKALLVTTAAPSSPSSPSPGERASAENACATDLRAALPGVAGARASAVAPLPGDRLLVLSQAPGRPGVVWLGVVGPDGQSLPVRAGDPLTGSDRTPQRRSGDDEGLAVLAINPLLGALTLDRVDPPLAGLALAIDWGSRAGGETTAAAPFSLIVVDAGGDQAYRLASVWDDDALIVAVVGEYLPLRRYQGLGLAALPAGMTLHAYPDARLFYRSEAHWAPLLALAEPRHLRAATLTTPAWDSRLPDCVWHRLAIDLRLPPGTAVGVETRCAGNADDLAHADWRTEPALLRSASGSELPWRALATPPNGTWETLLQAAHGRWLQVRLTIAGDGRQTPSLKALRVWYPRFSYAREYLPPVFRADPTSADLLDRLLALFEGEFTRWEDRIAAAQWLFDARTAPLASLEWLAGWLGVAFDAATDEPRRRLLIRHAMTGHGHRGTPPGLLLEATLAWETVVDEAWLSTPAMLAERPHGVRLQELFGLLAPLPSGSWRPADGRAALLRDDWLAADPTLADPAELAALELPGAAALAALQPDRRARLQRALGFVPRGAIEEARLWAAWCDAAGGSPGSRPPLPVDEADDGGRWTAYLQASQPCAPLRQRWQDFLARRWRRVSALNTAWGSRWRSFARIPSPLVLPANDAALADWHRFEAQILRRLSNAHRFRIILPLPGGELDLDDLARRRAAVLRVVERDKPAHTTAEVRFGFDLFRVGEARLGLDTRLENGLARRPQLAALADGSAFAAAVLGRSEIGGGRLAASRPAPLADRIGLDRGDTFFLRRPS